MAEPIGPTDRGPGYFPLLTEGKLESYFHRPRSLVAEVDTFGFAFKVSGDVDLVGATITASVEAGTGEVHFDRARRSLKSGLTLSTGVGGKAWVEGSLPKAATGSNVEALRWSEAVEVARAGYDEACEFVEPEHTGKVFELSTIVRLDPVRDFDDVAHVPELLDGLAGVQRTGSMKVRRFADVERNRAESLRVGPKSWADSIYDKHAETKGEAAPGRLRTEGRFHGEQLSSAWASDGGFLMRQVVDVSEEKVALLRRASFERVGFDREVVGMSTAQTKIAECESLDLREKCGFWTFLTAPLIFEGSPPTLRKYRRLAAEMGIEVGSAVADGHPVLIRLDYESGREVARVA